MLVDEMPRSFVKKNNSYSHCPLKKRPVNVMPAPAADDDKLPKADIKEEMIEVTVDEISEPENLSTKPEDLSRTSAVAAKSPKRPRSPSPVAATVSSPIHYQQQHYESPVVIKKRSPSPVSSHATRTPSPSIVHHHPPPPPPATNHHHPHHNHHHHHHPSSPAAAYHQHHHHPPPHYPIKAITPPAASAATPIHPVAKKARVEVIQHDNNQTTSTATAAAAPMHFMASKSAAAALEPLNLNGPVEPLAHYATPGWVARAPLYHAPHYLPYHHHHPHHHHAGTTAYQRYPTDLYPTYPVYSSPEHQSISPSPPHAALTTTTTNCPTIQRPIARSYASHWAAAASPDHCGLSPTSSLASSNSLRSPPPPISPEDLSSPGSDSGRSSAGSISAGLGSPLVVKMEKNNGGGPASPVTSISSGSSTSGSSSSSSPRYQCPDCAKSYSTYSGLSKHQQFHCAAAEGQAKKTFTCKYCEKVYLTLGALKMHIRTHTLPCKCHLCGKAFSRPWLLQGHIRTHTGEKPFSCQHCNRAFADRSNLRAHLQTHSDVKKYSCSSCSKTFSRMSLLTKHQEGGCPGVAVPIGYGC